MGWVQFCLAESQSRLYPHMRAKFGSDPTAGSKILSFKFISRFHCLTFHLIVTLRNDCSEPCVFSIMNYALPDS